MAPTDENRGTGRGQRTRKRTTKAQAAYDAGAPIPGEVLFSPTTDSQPSSAVAKRENDMARAKGVAFADPAAGSIMHASTNSLIPPFGENEFSIYHWPHPKPKDFTDLSPAHRKFKKANDSGGLNPILFDDSEFADDWYDFAGSVEAYPENEKNAREYAIARTFVARAKHAYVAGKSWKEFENEEEMIDSTALAKKEPDPQRREIMLEEALDNDIRLAVFEQLKPRLELEIWSQRPRHLRRPGEAWARYEQRMREAKEERERTVLRWESRCGLSGQEHPLPVFKNHV